MSTLYGLVGVAEPPKSPVGLLEAGSVIGDGSQAGPFQMSPADSRAVHLYSPSTMTFMMVIREKIGFKAAACSSPVAPYQDVKDIADSLNLDET